MKHWNKEWPGLSLQSQKWPPEEDNVQRKQLEVKTQHLNNLSISIIYLTACSWGGDEFFTLSVKTSDWLGRLPGGLWDGGNRSFTERIWLVINYDSHEPFHWSLWPITHLTMAKGFICSKPQICFVLRNLTPCHTSLHILLEDLWFYIQNCSLFYHELRQRFETLIDI